MMAKPSGPFLSAVLPKRNKPDDGEVQFVYISSAKNGIPDLIPTDRLTRIGGVMYVAGNELGVLQPIGLEMLPPIGPEVPEYIGLEVTQPIGLDVGQPIGHDPNVGGIRRLKNKALIRQPKTDNPPEDKHQPIGLESPSKADAEATRKTVAEDARKAADEADDARQARVERAYQAMWDIQLRLENDAAEGPEAEGPEAEGPEAEGPEAEGPEDVYLDWDDDHLDTYYNHDAYYDMYNNHN